MTNTLVYAARKRDLVLVSRLLAPNMVTALRVLAVPFVIASLARGQNYVALLIFVAAMITDMADGYLARRFNAQSSLGAYLDAVADFVLILSVYVYFCVSGSVHFYLILIIAAMFGQFLITSRAKILIYDPVGKRFGALLFASLFFMMLLPQKPYTCISCYLVTGAAAVSLVTRIIFLCRR